MVEKLKNLICCGTGVNSDDSARYGELDGVGLWCDVCGKRAFGIDRETAIDEYKKIQNGKANSTSMNKPNQNAPAVRTGIPRNPDELAVMIKSDERIIEVISPILSGNKSSIDQVVSNNLRYIVNAKQLEKVWKTPAGAQSIVRSVEDAFSMGAELGKMGDIVPYGETCEFIPTVEAYVFSLTNGKNAPFENIEIELVHEKDDARISRKDGNFSIDLEMGIPRGEVVAVAVYGFSPRTGKVEGEVYDKERLMKKAREHSTSYRYFLNDVAMSETMRSEGKISTENGREYFIKKMFKKGGGSWDKKVFIDEMTNPYAGADQPEMLRKIAGKSFLRKYQRVRNSEAAMDEVRTNEKSMDMALNLADDIVNV